MIHIAICDDSKENFILLYCIIKSFFNEEQAAVSIKHFYDGAHLLSAIKDGFRFDLIYLKIELEKQSGLEIGDEIRNRQQDTVTQIVFFSQYPHYAMKLFPLRPTDFLLLPFEKSRVIDSLQTANQISPLRQPMFSFSNRKTVKNIPYQNILYFESKNRKIDLYHTNGMDSFYGKLDDIEAELKQHFFLRIHKSYLVNRAHIRRMDYNHVYLDTNLELPISRSRQKSSRQQVFR